MDILHVTASLSSRGGGVATYIQQLLVHHASSGHTLTACSLGDALFERDTAHLTDRIGLIAAPPTGPRALGYSRGLRQPVRQAAQTADLLHIHGLRTLLNIHARRLSKHYKKPLIISPHGQLYPQVLAQNRLRKAVMAKLFVDANLNAASCIHATSEAEAEHIRSYGLKMPIAVVPIGVDLESFSCEGGEAKARLDARYPRPGRPRRVLFLSLLNAKKGLGRLAQAWGELSPQFPGWQLMIAGPDAGYESSAREAFKASGQSGSVTWTGPVYGQEKLDLLAGCDLLVLPSDWENFGIVVIEALASGTPVVATKGAPWAQLVERSCGWWVDAAPGPITQAMREAMSLGDDERRAMGARGRGLIEAEYTWDRCAAQMHELYEAAISQGPWPDFVQTVDA
ncbi:MAG: glycosyltransferase [Planctomycetota bacterium]